MAPKSVRSGRPIIEVRDVSYTYDGSQTPVLDHVSMEIASGEFVAFIGQNGAGKTTLAKTFNGLLQPSGGEVFIDGSHHWQPSIFAKRIAN